MAKVIFDAAQRQVKFIADDGAETAFECRNDFFSKGGQHDALPDGIYTLTAEEPGINRAGSNGPGFGTFYIDTGDARERDIHGGGSSLADPFAPRQGWLGTYGCLRMQNEDGEELSRLIIDAGNAVEMTVINVDSAAAMIDGDGEQ